MPTRLRAIASKFPVVVANTGKCRAEKILYCRVRVERIAIVKCNLFFHYRNAKEI